MCLKSNVLGDHIGIFHEHIRKKGMSKKIYYYYATPRGETPLKWQNKWFDCISDAEELKIKKITTSETMLPLSNSLNLIQQPAKKRGGSGHQRRKHLRVNLFLMLLLVHLPHHLPIIVLIAPPLEHTNLLQQRTMKPPTNQSMHRLLC
jgi:hypothetical protein